MSYEGSEEHLCENGHRWTIDCRYAFEESAPPCPTCQAPSVWIHHIDDTNCDSVGYIPEEEWAKLCTHQGVVVVCDHGFPHIKEPARYRVPTEEELRAMEHYWDGKAYVRLSQLQR